MHMLLSIAVAVATAFGTEWLVDGWLGDDKRYLVGLGGVALMLLAGALVQASGINELTRFVRNAVIGAGIGAVLRWVGLRRAASETEPETQPDAPFRWSKASSWLLNLGWAGTLVGMGMIWTGVAGG